MKTIFLTCAAILSLASCANNNAPTAIDSTPGTKTVNQYSTTVPCSATDSRRGICGK